MPAIKKSARAVGKGLLWLLREGIPATALLIAAALLIWTVVGVNRHKIVLISGDYGDYGHIELMDRIGPQTKVLEFSATRIPSRVITYDILPKRFALVWPVPEVVEVLVRYQNPGLQPQEWSRTFLVACNKEGVQCKPLSALRGVILYGRSQDGKAVDRGWVYFLYGVRPPQEEAQPGQPSPQVLPRQQPQPGPSVTPDPRKQPRPLAPGTLIA